MSSDSPESPVWWWWGWWEIKLGLEERTKEALELP